MKTLILTILFVTFVYSSNIQKHLDMNSYLSEFVNKHDQFRQNLDKLDQDISQTKQEA